MIYTTKDYEGFRADMIQKLKEKFPEYSDFSETDMGIVLIELLASNLDMLSYYQDKIANELFLETAQERESIDKLCRMLGYELGEATPSEFDQVFEIIPQEGDFIIPSGSLLKTKGTDAEPSVSFETTKDLVIPKGCTGTEQDNSGNYLYTTPIVQGISITSEYLGSSTSEVGQSFLLDYSPVIKDSIMILIDEGSGYEKWERVNNFLDSTSTSKHFIVSLNDDGEATVTFGNGVSGKIPQKYKVDNILAFYRVGGGTEGNVGAKTIVCMPNKPAEVQATFNPTVARVLGVDKESIEVARQKAPAQLGSRWGAVTLEDFKTLAFSNKKVIRSNAISDSVNSLLITVYIVLNKEEDLSNVLAELYALYNDKKLIGTTVSIEEGNKVPTNFVVNVKTTTDYTNAGVSEAVKSLIATKFQLGTYDFEEVPEGSDFIIDILNMDSVKSATIETDLDKDTLEPRDIAVLGNITVNVTGGAEND